MRENFKKQKVKCGLLNLIILFTAQLVNSDLIQSEKICICSFRCAQYSFKHAQLQLPSKSKDHFEFRFVESNFVIELSAANFPASILIPR